MHVVEILAPFDFDYVWFDGEHGPFGLAYIEYLYRATELDDITSIASGPNISSSTILQYLNRGIIGPHISSRTYTEQLVAVLPVRAPRPSFVWWVAWLRLPTRRQGSLLPEV